MKIPAMKKRLAFLPAVFLLVSLLVPAASAAEETDVPAASAPWEKMFPDGLIKAGQRASAAKKNYKALEGKFVGVYHSASWCGPCRFFTPQLVKFYERNKKDFEVVFFSADKSEDDMKSYVKKDKMKWLAVPFGKKPNAGVGNGIPELLVFSPDGALFTKISGSSGQSPDPRLADLRTKMDEWLAVRAETEK